MPNARGEPPLEAVGSSAMIMIEASPSAYHWGMLSWGKQHAQQRRRPQAGG
jgi:hypothetical protein